MKDDAVGKREGLIVQLLVDSRLDLLRTPKEGRGTDYGDDHYRAQHCSTHTLHTLSSAPVQASTTAIVTLLSRYIPPRATTLPRLTAWGKGRAPIKLGVGRKRNRPSETLCPRCGRGCGALD